MPVSIGSTITAGFYNTIQATIQSILGPSGYNGTVTSSQVAVSSIDTAAQWNKLRADINACRTIQTGSAFTNAELPALSSTQVIRASDVNLYETAANTVFANYGGNLVLVNGAFTDTRTTAWTGTIDNEVVISFASLAAANSFFAGNGELRLTLSQSTNANAQDALWVTNLNQVGTLIFNNITTSITGTAGSALNVGWNAMTSSYQMIFNGNRLHSGSSYTYVAVDDLYVYAKLNAAGNGIVLKTVMTNGDNGTISASTMASYGLKKQVSATSPTFAFLSSNSFNLAVTQPGTTPTITAYSASGTTGYMTTLNITSNVTGYAFAVAQLTGTTAPTVANWPSLANNINVVAGTPTTMNIPLPAPSTAYTIYTFVEDQYGNASAISSTAVTTTNGGATTGSATVGNLFKVLTYTGDGTNRVITTGIDLTGGGLVWTGLRDGTSSSDTFNSPITGSSTTGTFLTTNNTGGKTTNVSTYTATGYTALGTSTNGALVNATGKNFVAWVFKKAAKFFDTVQYTGTGAATATVAHSLTVAPGMVITRNATPGVTEDWYVAHQGSGAGSGYVTKLNTNDLATTTGITVGTTTTFNVANNANWKSNTTGNTYEAFLFADDPSGDIKCGILTTAGSPVSLGWEPQYLMVKPLGSTDDWTIVDTTRGWPTSGTAQRHYVSSTLGDQSTTGFNLVTGSGFTIAAYGQVSYPLIYMAIRAPALVSNVFAATKVTGTGAARSITLPFQPDLLISLPAAGVSIPSWVDSSRGAQGANSYLVSTSNALPTSAINSVTAFTSTGYTLGAETNGNWNTSGRLYTQLAFKKTTGVFDLVQYTGTSASLAVTHNLGVTPELLIIRRFTGAASDWIVYSPLLNSTVRSINNLTLTSSSSTYVTALTSSSFTLGTSATVNTSAGTFMAYLFASNPGVSKVGTYTNTSVGGSDAQDINCGFQPRFVLIKNITTANTNWFVWNAADGMAAGASYRNTLNTNGTLTNDSDFYVTPTGFHVGTTNQSSVNITGASYIYLAIA